MDIEPGALHMLAYTLTYIPSPLFTFYFLRQVLTNLPPTDLDSFCYPGRALDL